MPPMGKEKNRGKKKKQQKKKVDPRKLEIFEACAALGDACNWVEDHVDAERYYKRAKEGYEEQLGRDSEKALDATRCLIANSGMSDKEIMEQYRDLLKRMETALGEENVVTLTTLNELGCELDENEEYEEAIRVYERCLAGRIKVQGKDHKDTLGSLHSLGVVYRNLENYEKGLEYYERALEGYEMTLGKTRPDTLATVTNIAVLYMVGMNDYDKAEQLFESAQGT